MVLSPLSPKTPSTMSEYNTQENEPLQVVGNDTLQAIERAQIDTQIATAKRYPRNIQAVKREMLSVATMDEDTASACFYTVPRGGKSIQGPSVRLAEIALSAYGNVKAGTRILSVHSGENPHAVVQAVMHDLEKNIAYSVEKRRRITTKKNRDGTRKPVDDDDIQLAVNAGSAIAFRDAVFKVVPGAIVRSVLDEAKKVAVGDVKSLATKREKTVMRLKQMGASEKQILEAAGVSKIEEILIEQLEVLIGIGTSIRDGMPLEEAFGAKEQEAPNRPVFKESAKPESAPAPEPPPTDQAPQSPQEKLAAIVTEAGYTFDDFATYCASSGFQINNATAFSEVPIVRANQMIKAQSSLIAALGERNGGAK